jgi:hypothetical protein
MRAPFFRSPVLAIGESRDHLTQTRICRSDHRNTSICSTSVRSEGFDNISVKK